MHPKSYLLQDTPLHQMAAPALTVSQIERLAKAGVKVELPGPVCIVPDAPEPLQSGTPDHLIRLVHERWAMAMRAKHPDNTPFYLQPAIAAVGHDDKVYVFVAPFGHMPEIIVDEAAIFPSDALMAKLHLMLEHGK